MKLSLYAWETKTLPNLEMVSHRQVRNTLLLDRAHFAWSSKDSKDPSSVPGDTIELTYTMINSWLLMLSDFELQEVAQSYRSKILSLGLWATLKEVDETSARILEDRWSLENACPLLARGLSGLGARRVKEIYSSVWAGDPPEDVARLAIALLVLRYPLRYSPSDVVDEETIGKFLQINTQCKKYQTRVTARRLTNDVYEDYNVFCEHKYIWTLARSYMHEILHNSRPVGYEDIRNSNRISLPKGSVQDCCKCTFCKTYTYFKVFHESTVCTNEQEYSVQLALVNKNWKRKRIIAPEDMYHAVLTHENERVLDAAISMSKYRLCMPLHDQGCNREMALAGSRDGLYDTHDLSSASDSISRLAAYQCLTRPWRKGLLDAFSYKLKLPNGQVRTSYVMATSGNGCTFILELLIFYCICRVAAHFAGFDDSEVARGTVFRVYGDDIVCRHEMSDILMQLLKTLGFTHNKKKSFYTQEFLYRESCGGEYYQGWDVSPIYWPRNYAQPDTNLPDEYGSNGKTASLVALVNRFAFEEENELLDGNRCHQFLLATLKNLYPKLQLGGSVLGSPSIRTPLYKYNWVDGRKELREYSPDPLRAEDGTIAYEVDIRLTEKISVRDTPYSTVLGKEGLEDVFAHREKWVNRQGTIVEADRWIEFFRVGWGRLEKHICAVRHLYKGNASMSQIGLRRIAIKRFFETVEAERSYKSSWMDYDKNERVYSNMIDIRPNMKALLQSIVHGGISEQGFSFLARATRPRDEEDLTDLAIALTAIDLHTNVKLYLLPREGTRINVAVNKVVLKTQKPMELALRSEVSVLETKRIEHTDIDKSICRCHSLSTSEREAVWASLTYQLYLLQGPEYSQDIMINGEISLDETLNVSKKRRNFSQAYSGAVSTLVQKSV